jgi:hypothetical protein
MITATDLVTLFKPWADLYGHSKVLSAVVTGVHVGALTFGGGLAIAADRMTLRARRGGAEARARQLAELQSVHRPVLLGLVALFVSGVMMASADLATFLPSPVFWLKLGVVTLLLINGAVLQRTEALLLSGARGDGAVREDVRPLWDRLRLTAWCSLALWGTTLAVGIALSNVS